MRMYTRKSWRVFFEYQVEVELLTQVCYNAIWPLGISQDYPDPRDILFGRLFIPSMEVGHELALQ